MPGGLGDLPELPYCYEERSAPNSVAKRSGEWILALPALSSCLCTGWRPGRCRSWHVGKVVFMGLLFQEYLGLGEEPAASECNLGSAGPSVGQ